jgi:hypothetical protein
MCLAKKLVAVKVVTLSVSLSFTIYHGAVRASGRLDVVNVDLSKSFINLHLLVM